MKHYHFPFSSNSRKVAMTLAQLNIPVETVIVDLSKLEQRKPDYLALNPNAKVPTLVDGDLVLWESNAIMAYLADKTEGGDSIYPKDLRARADVNRWLFWGANHWGPSIAILNWENVVKKMLGAGDPDPAQVQRGETFVKDNAKVLDDHLAKRTWLSGDRLTIADFAIAAPLMYTRVAKIPVEGFANLQAWLARVQELDAWKKTAG